MKNPFVTRSLSLKSIKEILISLYNDFMAKRVLASASRLTYSTLLATVPILAVVFAIARGFGYNIYIEEWFRDLLKAQPVILRKAFSSALVFFSCSELC